MGPVNRLWDSAIDTVLMFTNSADSSAPSSRPSRETLRRHEGQGAGSDTTMLLMKTMPASSSFAKKLFLGESFVHLGCAESKRAVVRDVDCLRESFARKQQATGPKISRDTMVTGSRCPSATVGFIEKTGAIDRFPPVEQFRPGLGQISAPARDPFQNRFARNGPISVSGSSGSPTLSTRILGQLRRQKLVVNFLRDDETLCGDARLSGVLDPSSNPSFHCRRQIRARHNDVGSLRELEHTFLNLPCRFARDSLPARSPAVSVTAFTRGSSMMACNLFSFDQPTLKNAVGKSGR